MISYRLATWIFSRSIGSFSRSKVDRHSRIVCRPILDRPICLNRRWGLAMSTAFHLKVPVMLAPARSSLSFCSSGIEDGKRGPVMLINTRCISAITLLMERSRNITPLSCSTRSIVTQVKAAVLFTGSTNSSNRWTFAVNSHYNSSNTMNYGTYIDKAKFNWIMEYACPERTIEINWRQLIFLDRQF